MGYIATHGWYNYRTWACLQSPPPRYKKNMAPQNLVHYATKYLETNLLDLIKACDYTNNNNNGCYDANEIKMER